MAFSNYLALRSSQLAALNATAFTVSTITATSTMAISTLFYSTMLGSTITVSTMFGSTLSGSTMAASSITANRLVLSTLTGSTITVSTLIGSTLSGSTMVMSSIIASGLVLSTLTVSSINNNAPGTGIFSTLTVSSIVSVSSIQTTSTMYTSSMITTGSVGIGTANPGYALDVTGSARASGSLIFGASGAYVAGCIYSDANWGCILRARTTNPTTAAFLFSNSADTHLMAISNTGSVGIGTDTPGYLLHVNGSFNCTSLYVNGSAFTGSGSVWSLNGTSAYYNAGSVGIGTSAPSSKFSVYTSAISQFNVLSGEVDLFGSDTSGSSLCLWITSNCSGTSTYATSTYGRLGRLAVNYNPSQGGTGSASYYRDWGIDTSGNLFFTQNQSTTQAFNIGSSGIFVQGATMGTTTASNVGNFGLRISQLTSTQLSVGQIVGQMCFHGWGRTYASSFIRCITDSTNGYDDAGALAFGTSSSGAGATEVMRISETGNVGIGTNAPAYPLSIVGAQSINGTSSQYSKTTTSGNLLFNTSSDSNAYPTMNLFNYDHNNNGIFFDIIYTSPNWQNCYTGTNWGIYKSGGILQFAYLTGTAGTTGGLTNMMVLTSTGVGIGTANPSHTLQVAGAINCTSLLVNGTAVATGTGSVWGVNGSSAYYTSGNVGIGTAAPTAALQVSSGSSAYGMFRLVNSTANTSGEVSMGYFNNPSASYSGSVGSAWAHGIAAYGVGANNFGLGCAVTGLIMGISSGGNVGIGTNAPATSLHVYSTSAANSFLIQNTSSASYASMYFQNNTPVSGYIGMGGSAIGGNYQSNFFIQSPNAIAFNTNGNGTSGTNAMYINSSGNVGIGTVTPAYPITVSTTGGTGLEVNRTGASTNYGVGMIYSLTSATGSFRGEYAWTLGGATTIATSAQSQAYGYYAIDLAAGSNTFGANSSYTGAYFFMTTSAACFPKTNVGIGTAAPTAALQVSSGSSTYGMFRLVNSTANTSGEVSMGYFNNPSASYSGSVGSAWAHGIAAYGVGANNFGLGCAVTGIIMGISSGGQVGIGTTAPNFQLHLYKDSPGILFTSSAYPSNPWYLFVGTSNGAMYLGPNINTGTPGCNVAIGASAWAATSDLRLKKSITPLPSALDNILQLNPILFQYKTDSDSETLREGFIAQEVRSIFPSKWIVSETGMPEKQVDDNGELYDALSVSSTQLIPHLVKSIQELSSQNTKLQAQLDAVLTRLSAAGI